MKGDSRARGMLRSPPFVGRRMSSPEPVLEKPAPVVTTAMAPDGITRELAALTPALLLAGLYVARVVHSGEALYGFLLFNVALAAIPALLAWGATTLHARGERRASMAVLAAWLLFLPNAPYVITDLIHLRERAGAPLWYDAAILGTAALSGLMLGAVSLARVHDLVQKERGPLTAHACVALASLLSGYGIYLGRFSRLNSWDVALHPVRVLRHAVPPLLDPLGHPRAWAVTLVFGAVLGVTHLVLSGARPLRSRGGNRGGARGGARGGV